MRAFFSSDFFCDRTFFAKVAKVAQVAKVAKVAKVAQVAVFEVVNVEVQRADQS